MEELGIILLLPPCLMSIASTLFSGLKALTILHTSIPAAAGLAFIFFAHSGANKKHFLVRVLTLLFLFAPFYYTTAWADWQFTYFDVIPNRANTKISEGFGKGIKTNQPYSQLHEWIEKTSQKLTNEDDFMISYIVSPMTHMIAKRRPSLDDTFITFGEVSPSHYAQSIQTMKKQNREPSIAFVFERMPALFPVSLEKGTVTWPQRQFLFKYANDPISSYIKNNMVFAGQFTLSRENDHVIRCYVRKN